MKTYTIRAVTKGGVKLPTKDIKAARPSTALSIYQKFLDESSYALADIQCIDIDIAETDE